MAVNIYVSCETSEGLFSLTEGKKNCEGGIMPKAAFQSIWRTKPLSTRSSAWLSRTWMFLAQFLWGCDGSTQVKSCNTVIMNLGTLLYIYMVTYHLNSPGKSC